MNPSAPVARLPLPDEEHPLAVEEVRLLWSFVHGDIMDRSTRSALRRSWGLCARHSWGHAIVEIELWESGAGKRHGHQPFDVSVLLQDLILSALHELTASHPRRLLHRLAGDGRCLICADLGPGPIGGMPLGYAGSDSAALTEEANALQHTRSWLTETVDVWRPHACPTCLPPEPEHAGVLCRRHLIVARSTASAELAGEEDELRGLGAGLGRLVSSMSQDGAPGAREDDASWIEALGWLHGWDLPAALAARPKG